MYSRTSQMSSTPAPTPTQWSFHVPLNRETVFSFRAATLRVAGKNLTRWSGMRAGIPLPERPAAKRSMVQMTKERKTVMKRSEHAKKSKLASLRTTQGRGAAARSGDILPPSRWALAVGVLALGLMPQAASARPLDRPATCLPPDDKAQCARDSQSCEGAVCAGMCRRGCKIDRVF